MKSLGELMNALGDRRITVCRELTKRHETAFLTTISEALKYYESTEPKGECVLVVEGRSLQERKKEEQESWEKISIPEHMERYLSQGIEKKEAMKLVAKDRGIGKRDVYRELLNLQEKE